jgi:hypothetical protein
MGSIGNAISSLFSLHDSDVQDEICQIVMAKHRFFKVGIHYNS